jgi:hypothetical protein
MLIRIFVRLGGPGGISQDAKQVERVLRKIRLQQRGGAKSPEWKFETCDPTMWGAQQLTVADMQIFLEEPLRLAVPWGRFNVCVVNPEWFEATAWNWALAPATEGGLDLFVFKCDAAAELFPELDGPRRIVMPWKTDMTALNNLPWSSKEDRVLYMVGGSVNKRAAARDVIAWWRPEWPPLEVWCSRPIEEGLGKSNVVFQTAYATREVKETRQRKCKWHLVASAAEGFGYTMAEAVACDAPIIWTGLSVFEWSWGIKKGRIPMVLMNEEGARLYRDPHRRMVSREAFNAAVEEILQTTDRDVRDTYAYRRSWGQKGFADGWESVYHSYRKAARPSGSLPTPFPKGTIPPKVAIITVTRDRVEWWYNMVQNVTKQTWPVSRLEWIIVEDGGGETLEKRVRELQARVPALTVRYVRHEGTIGAKRNAGVAAASEDVNMFVMMDDDDHYPVDSVATRCSWLTLKPIVYNGLIPMYDITRYISAFNVPPLNDAPKDRVSEATLAFTRDAWVAQPFADVNMGEGASFLEGRESQSVEIPPAGVIVSFIHKANTSSRRTPKESEPNGCHFGFSDEYFRYLHLTGGVV